jgi:integral membrane protein
MGSPLTRFRVMAYVVGVLLIVIMFVGMPLKYLAGEPAVIETVGPAHGFLYMVYLVVAFHLGVTEGWPLRRTVLLMLAGTVPVLSFVAERWATSQVRERATVS